MITAVGFGVITLGVGVAFGVNAGVGIGVIIGVMTGVGSSPGCEEGGGVFGLTIIVISEPLTPRVGESLVVVK